MRDSNKWAKQHRAGLRRARAIIDRQDRVLPEPTWSAPIRYRSERENMRRRKQIEAGQLTTSNGLV